MAKTEYKPYAPWNLPEVKATPSGERFKDQYLMQLDKDGHKYLEKVGVIDTYAEIQAELEATKIENIIARCTDPNVLIAKAEQFFDARNIPDNLAEAQNLIIKMENEFYSLPPKVRAEFNNSPAEYVNQYGTENWYKALGTTVKGVNDVNGRTSDETNSKGDTADKQPDANNS